MEKAGQWEIVLHSASCSRQGTLLGHTATVGGNLWNLSSLSSTACLTVIMSVRLEHSSSEGPVLRTS